MKLVLFQTSGRDEPVPGLLTDRGVVDIAGITENGHTPQLTMQVLIDGFDKLRPTENMFFSLRVEASVRKPSATLMRRTRGPDQFALSITIGPTVISITDDDCVLSILTVTSPKLELINLRSNS